MKNIGNHKSDTATTEKQRKDYVTKMKKAASGFSQTKLVVIRDISSIR